MEYADFKIPESFLERLAEFSGNDEKCQGFLLGMVNKDGDVDVIGKGPPVVLVGIKTIIDEYYDQHGFGSMGGQTEIEEE